MIRTLRTALVGAVLLAAAYGQTARTEFDAASIRVNPPRNGFHAPPETFSGGPAAANPGMFRCTNCTLGTLIVKAFDLQDYQFPGKSSVMENSFDIMARVPANATEQEFQAMLQSLLKDRFGLTSHFKEKSLRGYHLVVAKNGPKLKESTGTGRPAVEDRNGHGQNFAQGGDHAHTGLMVFGASGSYRGDHQTTADLARLLSSQIALPVDDQTGLKGAYDIALSWTGGTSSAGNRVEAAWAGAGHDHGDAGAPRAAGSAPSLFDALQEQLGLRLVPAEQALAQIFVIDHVQPLPTAN